MRDTVKKVIKSIIAFVLPITSVWIIVVYLRVLNYSNHYNIMEKWIIVLLFIPVVIFESLTSSYMMIERPVRLWPRLLKDKIFLLMRVFFWLIIFTGWVLVMGGETFDRKSVELINFSAVPMAGMVYIAESYLTGVAFVLWMIIYYFFTVRKRILKIFNSLILPGLLSYMLFYHFYFMGGVGECSPKRISRQQGVEIFYSSKDFPLEDYVDYRNWTQINRFYPRDIYVDIIENALYANYANTYGKPSAYKNPTLLRIDLETKETKYFVSYYARAISADTPTIIISPWFEKKIYELDKYDLSVMRSFPSQVEIRDWETIDIYHDEKRNALFVTNDLVAALFKYDYETGILLDQVYPEVKYGGCLWNLQLSDRTGMIYLTGFGSEEDIFEIDPETLDIQRTLDLNTLGGSSLGLDDENGLLYFQDGGTDKLFEIEIDTLKVKRILKGEVHARRMHTDKKRNALYMVSFFYGTFFAVDLESGRRLWTIKVGGKPYGLAISGDTAYVNSRAGIIKIDIGTVWKEYGH